MKNWSFLLKKRANAIIFHPEHAGCFYYAHCVAHCAGVLTYCLFYGQTISFEVANALIIGRLRHQTAKQTPQAAWEFRADDFLKL